MRIGVDIAGQEIRMGIVDSGKIYKKITEPFKPNDSENQITEHIKTMLRKIMNSNIRGIGIGVPSVVNAGKGIVYNAINIPSWKEVHLKSIIEDEFHIPVHVDNDCNCFAFGERYHGEGTPYRNIVCIMLDTGLGAGIIIDDKLYGGHNNGAGEIGCLPYRDANYERYCSSHFFYDQYNTTDSKAYTDALNKNQKALKLWTEFGYHLGNLINTVLFIYDPEAIILGGRLTKASDLYINKMSDTVRQFLFPESVKRLKILFSQRDDICLLGAATLI